MVRAALATVVAAALVSLPSGYWLQAAGVGPQEPQLEFEVASIKRNPDALPTFGRSGPPLLPSTGQESMTWVTAGVLVLRAYPVDVTPADVRGLPDWASAEHYDVLAKGKPNATPDERRQMWRALLADRMKLAAHYETHPRPAYALVVARSDRRLGPQLKPSSLDCPALDLTGRVEPPPPELMDALRQPGPLPPSTERQLLSRCRSLFNAGGTVYAGAVEVSSILMAIRMNGGTLDRPVVDRTGLDGLYEVKLSFARPSLNPPGPDDAPSLFTALQEQLGLKLEPVTIDGQVVVVDRIERPTEN